MLVYKRRNRVIFSNGTAVLGLKAVFGGTRQMRITPARLLLTTLAAAGMIAFIASKPHSAGFFVYLSDHPNAARFVRDAFSIVGKEDDFDEQISLARLDLLFESFAEDGVLESILRPEPPAPVNIASEH